MEEREEAEEAEELEESNEIICVDDLTATFFDSVEEDTETEKPLVLAREADVVLVGVAVLCDVVATKTGDLWCIQGSDREVEEEYYIKTFSLSYQLRAQKRSHGRSTQTVACKEEQTGGEETREGKKTDKQKPRVRTLGLERYHSFPVLCGRCNRR